MAIDYFKANRTPAALEFVRRHPKAFVLHYLIAHRAAYRDDHINGLRVGQCFIGASDLRDFGFTEAAYRTAKKSLERAGLVSFTGSNHGTLATLLDGTIFDVRRESKINGQTTSERRADDGRNDGQNDGPDACANGSGNETSDSANRKNNGPNDGPRDSNVTESAPEIDDKPKEKVERESKKIPRARGASPVHSIRPAIPR